MVLKDWISFKVEKTKVENILLKYQGRETVSEAIFC